MNHSSSGIITWHVSWVRTETETSVTCPNRLWPCVVCLLSIKNEQLLMEKTTVRRDHTRLYSVFLGVWKTTGCIQIEIRRRTLVKPRLKGRTINVRGQSGRSTNLWRILRHMCKYSPIKGKVCFNYSYTRQRMVDYREVNRNRKPLLVVTEAPWGYTPRHHDVVRLYNPTKYVIGLDS